MTASIGAIYANVQGPKAMPKTNPKINFDMPSMRCVGYRQVWQYLQGELSQDDMICKGIVATRQLAKRQWTWLRKEQDAIWLDSTKKGYRDLTGHELASMQFQAAFLNPQRKADKIFSSIIMDGEGKVMGQPCYKLICKPNKKFDANPITMYVDKKTFLLKKRIEKHGNAKSGYFTVSTVLHDYKSFDGILVPQTIISNAHGNLMELEVTAVKWNEKIHISAFDPPEMFK